MRGRMLLGTVWRTWLGRIKCLLGLLFPFLSTLPNSVGVGGIVQKASSFLTNLRYFLLSNSAINSACASVRRFFSSLRSNFDALTLFFGLAAAKGAQIRQCHIEITHDTQCSPKAL